jgi:hypothetical protein
MTSDDAETHLFRQVMGLTKDYADAAKRLARPRGRREPPRSSGEAACAI